MFRVAAEHLEGAVHVGPVPVALDDLDHRAARLQKQRIGQVAGVHRNKHPRGSDDLELLLERGAAVKFHDPHLKQE